MFHSIRLINGRYRITIGHRFSEECSPCCSSSFQSNGQSVKRIEKNIRLSNIRSKQKKIGKLAHHGIFVQILLIANGFVQVLCCLFQAFLQPFQLCWFKDNDFGEASVLGRRQTYQSLIALKQNQKIKQDLLVAGFVNNVQWLNFVENGFGFEQR